MFITYVVSTEEWNKKHAQAQQNTKAYGIQIEDKGVDDESFINANKKSVTALPHVVLHMYALEANKPHFKSNEYSTVLSLT